MSVNAGAGIDQAGDQIRARCALQC
jgi:hypothetical protein